jgi:uncharacterized protein YjaG (DUF416 family)
LLRFDQTSLVTKLGSLPAKSQTAFATAVASRHRTTVPVTSTTKVEETIGELWRSVDTPDAVQVNWDHVLNEVLELVPEDTKNGDIRVALVEDALSALAYAVRSWVSKDPQEAAWAARRGYEAADQAAIRTLGLVPGSAESERLILAHEFVQRELSRQELDYRQLLAGDIGAVRRRSLSESAFTAEELAGLPQFSA